LTKSETVWHKSWNLPGIRAATEKACEELLDAARRLGYDEEELFGVHLALEEAFMNAIQHGNRGDSSKHVWVESLITPEKIDISITDEGTGFDPDGLPDPRLGDNLYKCSGRGVLLIRAYMDVVEYNDRGNCVHMVKFRDKEGRIRKALYSE
jgi:serine/threonine-protein kinase RsbW